MLKTSIVVLLVAFTTKLAIVNAVTTEDIAPIATKSITMRVKSKSEVLLLIEKISQQKSVSAEVLTNVIECESQFNPMALGDHGHSRGLVQIYDDYNPTITHEQAYDPEFAINFLAEGIKSGQGYRWSCYRKLYSE